MPQDAWLVRGTVAQNIVYGAPGDDQGEVQKAARLALVDEFSTRQSHRLGVRSGEGGLKLSGGQRRRIAIARAIIGRRPLLLLDEPTEGLDPSAKQVVIDAVRSVAKGRTVLIVTHNRELARVADRVIIIGFDGATERCPVLFSTADVQ